MNNKTLIAVVFILLLGIFTILGLGITDTRSALMSDTMMEGNASAMNKTTVQNN